MKCSKLIYALSTGAKNEYRLACDYLASIDTLEIFNTRIIYIDLDNNTPPPYQPFACWSSFFRCAFFAASLNFKMSP